MKKLLSVLLSIIVVCVSSFQVQAENTKNINITAEIKQLIATELSYYEQCKYVVDMENIDFTNLYVSDKINVYEYLPSGFVKISEAYLIYETDRIVTLAYLVNDEQVQIMTSLAHLIAETDVESLALVYDEDGAFVYDGINFRQIFHDPSRKVEDRANIANVTEEQKESISLIDSNNTQRLEYYSNSTNARAQTNYVLEVSYVTQKPYTELCWAATSAMIYNYLNNASKTAYGFAVDYFAFYNKSFSNSTQLQYQVANYYGQLSNMKNYQAFDMVPTDNLIISNMQLGKPIYASFTRTSDSLTHACCLHGINTVAGRLMVKDPQMGSLIAYANSDGSYSMTYPGDGEVLTFTSAICHYWG